MNDTFQLPEVFSTVRGLGAPMAWFRPRARARVGNLVIFLLLLGAGCLVFFYGSYATYAASRAHGPALIDDTLFIPGIFTLVFLLLSFLPAWGAYANWNKAAAVYEQGFVLRDRKGLHPWAWEQVVSFTAAVTRHYTIGIYTGTTHAYTLLNKQDERLHLDDSLMDVDQLAEQIEQSIFPILYAREAEQYLRGGTVPFGPVAINTSGIVIGKKTYPWAEVEQVSIQRGFLRVSKKGGGWFSGASAAASSIPNLRVLLSLIDQVTGVKAG